LIAFCTGTFLLTAAGLLDGRLVTTHWAWAAELAARYPRVQVDPQRLYIDECQILTSAGTAAAIDLSLHVVRQDYGAEIAAAVARRMVVPPHREGGQAQYIETPLLWTSNALWCPGQYMKILYAELVPTGRWHRDVGRVRLDMHRTE